METNKNNLLRIASIILIVCAVVGTILSAVNINSSLDSMSNLTAEERVMVEAQMKDAGVTMDQATGLVSGIAYVGLAFIVVLNIMQAVVGILGLRKAEKSHKFFTVWGTVLLILGIFGLGGGILTPLGICNLLDGIVAPVLFIIGGTKNKKALAG